MADIQIEANIKAGSSTVANAGVRMSVTAGIVVPFTAGFGPAPVQPQAKNTLKISSMDVQPKK